MKEEIMKKLISLAIALFFATAALAQELEVSTIITQEVVSGQLEQTVTVGDEITPTKISYTNVKSVRETPVFSDWGLSATCDNDSKNKTTLCTVAGKIKRNLKPETIKSYILVEDEYGKVAITYFTFNLKARPTTLKVIKGETTQSVKAGESISEIEIEYSGIKSFIFGSSPSGVKYDRDSENQIIKISGKVDANTASGEYKFIVRGVKQDNEKDTLKVEITFNVTGAPVSVSVAENATQKVTAGEAIKPILFSFTGANNYQLTKIPAGKFSASADGEKMIITVSGNIDENAKDGTYTIELEVTDGKETAKAQATVEVTHKVFETKIEVSENATQTVTAGDSIEPIVFKVEHMTELVELTGFPGGYEVYPENNTVYVVGKIKEDAKGSYTVKVAIKGADNSATAEATINVLPVTMKFDLVEGSATQTVVAGQDIVPMVYKYEHLKSVKGSGFPADLQVEQIAEKSQVKIYGTVHAESAAKEYVYTLELTDIYSEKTTITGKINVVKASSSSSEATSSSSEKIDSSSSKETSSSSETTKPTSSSSETAKPESSSSEKTVSSSSDKAVSSSSKETSSSSETTKPTSSSSEKSTSKSSSSEKAKSSSSTDESSSSSKKGKSSSSEKSSIVASVMPTFEFGYANNELVVVLPKPAMLRVQVFDMMGHLVESFAETVASSKSINLAHLAKGNYVVRMESARYARNAKIFVK